MGPRIVLLTPPPSPCRLYFARANRRDIHGGDRVAGALAAGILVELSVFSLFFPSSPAAVRSVASPYSGKGARFDGRALSCLSRRQKAELPMDSTDLSPSSSFLPFTPSHQTHRFDSHRVVAFTGRVHRLTATAQPASARLDSCPPPSSTSSARCLLARPALPRLRPA